jgi:trimethylamine corrinoid protein
MDNNQIYEEMAQSVIQGNRENSENLAKKAVEDKMNLLDVIEKGYVPGIQKVGELWENGEYFLPELITSADCMKAAMTVLQPAMAEARIETHTKGKVVIGTIEGDIHDIGKNLVSSMLSANGFDVFDLGADVKLESFLQKAEEKNADFICLSALLTTTMMGQKKFIEYLKEKKLKSRYKILVGGAPVNQKWADDIGADGYAENALTAVKLAQKLMEK